MFGWHHSCAPVCIYPSFDSRKPFLVSLNVDRVRHDIMTAILVSYLQDHAICIHLKHCINFMNQKLLRQTSCPTTNGDSNLVSDSKTSDMTSRLDLTEVDSRDILEDERQVNFQDERTAINLLSLGTMSEE
jgi:hypothetical protein